MHEEQEIDVLARKSRFYLINNKSIEIVQCIEIKSIEIVATRLKFTPSTV
jgi:hypothetical protein